MAAPPAAERVRAMELLIALSDEDYERRVAAGALPPLAPGLPGGYRRSGSRAGRNIDAIHGRAGAAPGVGLAGAVAACFGGGVRHALLCSGFYVLHGRCTEERWGLAPGSCETDGPLGVLALARAFAVRGVRTSIFCDEHNGPVIRAGYEAMLRCLGGDAAARLRRHSRCLPSVGDAPRGAEPAEVERILAAAPATADGPLLLRAARTAVRLKTAVSEAWGGEAAEPIDCLFALERLGAPYRNIRGRDIGEHTEPVDWLWPLLAPDAGGLAPGAAARLGASAEACGGDAVLRELRRAAGVALGALSLGVGDGGNEVGMGKVAHLCGVAELAPAGADFVALSENGCFRTCDHLVLATVSNWGGSAFEMAAHAMFPPPFDYLASLGGRLADVEKAVLTAITAPAVCSVDGIGPALAESVDGMAFEPHHRDLYDILQRLAEGHAPP